MKKEDTKEEPLVSVVTPVYNTDKYLSECIESVLRQTYKNWEHIIVNNCSTDRTLEIAERYAARDNRIRIHNNSEFLGILQNSNHAVRQMNPESKYCKILHADDWLFPECLSRMVEVAEAKPSVGIVSSYRLDEDTVNLDGLPYPSPFNSGREICRLNLLKDIYLFGSPTSLLIRSDLIRDRKYFYDESHMHADKEFCFEVLQHADFGFVHQVLTYTRRHNESNTSRVKRYNSTKISSLLILKKYGPAFLSLEEYRSRMKTALAKYHRFLAELLLTKGGKEQFELHRKELSKMGIVVHRSRLTKTILLEMLNLSNTYYRIRHMLKGNNNSQVSDIPSV